MCAYVCYECICVWESVCDNVCMADYVVCKYVSLLRECVCVRKKVCICMGNQELYMCVTKKCQCRCVFKNMYTYLYILRDYVWNKECEYIIEGKVHVCSYLN